jgi:predicted lipoprotein with Yx(FWY)xxD motif
MRTTRRELLGALGASVILAGCSGRGGSTGTTMDGDETTGTPATDRTVRVADHGELGSILVDSDGTTLYMFDNDSKGEGASACYDQCASAWPPLTVEGDPTVGGDVTASLTTFERDDGTSQVAAAGWPLYYFASDEDPGDANGQGVNDVWWALSPDGSPVESGSDSGGGAY